MIRRAFFLSSVVIFGSGLVVFAQGQPQNSPPEQEEPPLAMTVPKDYRYNARGRRDPFVNPVPKPKGAAAAPAAVRPPGLKGVMLREALITGVVTSREPSMNVVIISAPGARAPYFARVGDELYDAVVKNIKLETVTFALNTLPSDPNAPREIVRKVHPKPGEDR